MEESISLSVSLKDRESVHYVWPSVHLNRARFSSADVEISRAKSDLTFFCAFHQRPPLPFSSFRTRNRLVSSFETRACKKEKEKKEKREL